MRNEFSFGVFLDYATLEHLLLALIDDQDASAVMKACNVDLGALKKNLANYIDNELAGLAKSNGNDARPTSAFQRVVQRAVTHIQRSGREEVTDVNVLVAIFAETENPAVMLLGEQDMSRQDAVNFIVHGVQLRPIRVAPRTATLGQSRPQSRAFSPAQSCHFCSARCCRAICLRWAFCAGDRPATGHAPYALLTRNAVRTSTIGLYKR